VALLHLDKIAKILKKRKIPMGSEVVIYDKGNPSTKFVVSEDGGYHLDFKEYNKAFVVIRVGNKIVVLQ
jgi:hypothetical protein